MIHVYTEPHGLTILTDALIPHDQRRVSMMHQEYMRDGNLEGVCFRKSRLYSCAFANVNFRDADFRCAEFDSVDFIDCDFTGANLCHTEIRECNFHGATFTDTVFDPNVVLPALDNYALEQCGLVRCTVGGEDRVYGWRTNESLYFGNQQYTTGVYVAPIFSSCKFTDCHPGIYMDGLQRCEHLLYYAGPIFLVPCYSRASDLLNAGDKWRTRRLVVITEGEYFAATKSHFR